MFGADTPLEFVDHDPAGRDLRQIVALDSCARCMDPTQTCRSREQPAVDTASQ